MGKNNSDKKSNIWDTDNGFWGAPHSPAFIEKPHTFTGNKFNLDLVEGQKIDANEAKGLGELASNMKINDSTHISGEITFVSAEYRNSLGAFTIGADGTIHSATMAVVDTQHTGATFSLDAQTGDKEVGFFLISNGAGRYQDFQGFDLATGTMKFVTDYGTANAHASKVTDDGNKVTLVFTDKIGNDHVIEGPIWFTSDRAGSNSLNSDGMVHTISGVDGNNSDTLKIAFEDKAASVSDKDYNDTVFTVKMTDEVQSCQPAQHSSNDCHDIKDIIECYNPVTNIVNNFINNVTTNVANVVTTNVTATGGAAVALGGNSHDDLSAILKAATTHHA